MKKNLLKLLVIAILCAIITLFFCFCSIKYNSSFTSFTTTEQVINEVNEGIDSPGAGWYLLFAGGTAVAIDFAMAYDFYFNNTRIFVVYDSCFTKYCKINTNWY